MRTKFREEDSSQNRRGSYAEYTRNFADRTRNIAGTMRKELKFLETR